MAAVPDGAPVGHSAWETHDQAASPHPLAGCRIIDDRLLCEMLVSTFSSPALSFVELWTSAMDRDFDQEKVRIFPPLQGRVDGA
jgi:hypothetical protein